MRQRMLAGGGAICGFNGHHQGRDAVQQVHALTFQQKYQRVTFVTSHA